MVSLALRHTELFPDPASKTCANVKNPFDATSRPDGSSLKDSVNLQIPETPAITRNSYQHNPGVEPRLEETKSSPDTVKGLREVEKLEKWPFGPKLKSTGTIHRSGGGSLTGQAEESPVRRQINESPLPEQSVDRDTDVCPPSLPLSVPVPVSVPIDVPSKKLESPLKDCLECEAGRRCGLLETKVEISAQARTISDLESRLEKVNHLTQTTREQAVESAARASREFDAVIRRLEENHQRALEAKEEELQQAKARLEQAKPEIGKAVLCKDPYLTKASNEITLLGREIAAQYQSDNSGELTKLRTEVNTLKKRLVACEKSVNVVPTFIHLNLFDAAPELLAQNVFFDAEEKKKEVEKRRSRKQTFGRRLAHIRRERGQYPHREVYRHSPKPSEIYRDASFCLTEEPTGTIAAKRRELQDLGPGEVMEEDVRGGTGEGNGASPLEEMMAVPRNAIPCLVDGQLAYREGTRVSPPATPSSLRITD